MDSASVQCPNCEKKLTISDILKPDDAKDLTDNKNIGFFFWWWWWRPYYYYPYWYYRFGSSSKEMKKIEIDNITKSQFQNYKKKNGVQNTSISPSIDSTQTKVMKTIATPEGKKYSCIWNNKTNKADCDHYIDSNNLIAWIQYGYQKGEPLCPQCKKEE